MRSHRQWLLVAIVGIAPTFACGPNHACRSLQIGQSTEGLPLEDPGKTRWGFDDLPFARKPPFNVEKDVKSYGAVLRWPHKWIKLPLGGRLSVFYNNSENFTPSGSRNTIFQEALAVPFLRPELGTRLHEAKPHGPILARGGGRC